MSTPARLFLPAILALATAARCALAGTIDLPGYGFEIEALDGKPGEETMMALSTSLPSVEGFSANVNVMIQPFKGTLEDFANLSRKQFETLGWKLLKDKKVDEQEWMVEYTGKLQQGELHFYARTILKAGRVYVVTGTARDSQWEKVGATLEKHVQSFKLK